VTGERGDFKITVKKKARYVNEDLCTGCGSCAEKCPTSVVDDYNAGLGSRKAIFKHFPQGIPSVFTIDAPHCRQLGQGKKCGVCAKVCQAKAIDFEQKDRTLELEVAAIVLATGYEVFDPSQIPEYGYGRVKNVVTALEFERLLSASGPTAGHLDRPSDMALEVECEEVEKELKKVDRQVKQLEEKHGRSSDEVVQQVSSGAGSDNPDLANWANLSNRLKELEAKHASLQRKKAGHQPARKLAFIQCVGSRDFRFNRFCSSFCCMHSVKEAMIAYEHDNGVSSSIFYMDLRAVGRGFEEYKLRGGKQSGIQYVRGRVAEITEDEAHNPIVWYESTTDRQVQHEPFDMVVLATACVPASGALKVAETFGVELDTNGFFKTDPLMPLNSSRDGVFVCGCAQGPMDIPESVAQASSAAACAAEVVAPPRQTVAAGAGKA
jgi:heterodisulfide reductase subunit A-like polyferredoxin